MARQPKSLMEVESVEVAEKMFALKTAQLIRNSAEHEEIVAQAMAELEPAGFLELLKRTRDRRGAYHAINCIRHAKDDFPLEEMLLPWFEVIAEASDAVRRRPHAPLRELIRESFAESRKDLWLWRVTRRHRRYTDTHLQALVVFIGHGNDSQVMNDTLASCKGDITFQLGKWLERQLDMITRTPAEIAADQRARRDRNRLYWDPNYDPLKELLAKR